MEKEKRKVRTKNGGQNDKYKKHSRNRTHYGIENLNVTLLYFT